MRREKVEARNIKDGARDRSPPFRHPGRVRVVVVGGRQVRGEQGGRALLSSWRPNGLLRLLEKKGTQSVAGRLCRGVMGTGRFY